MLNRGFMPFPAAMEMIRKARFGFGPDRWELWVKRGLMDRAERIPGTNLYGLRPEQWMRLKRLIIIDHHLFGRKSPEAVAYFAALTGTQVPPELVAAHLCSGIEKYFTLMRRRMLQISNRRIDPRMMVESDARKLASMITNDLLKVVKIGNAVKREIARQFFDEANFVIVCMTYNVLPTRSLGNVLRTIGKAIFTAGTATVGAQALRKMLEGERERFVDPTIGENKILKEIEATLRDQPALILRACLDTGIAFAAMQRGFGIVAPTRPKRPPGKLTAKEREAERTFNAIVPLASSYLLAWNLDYPSSKALAALRRSGGAELERTVRRLDRISEWSRRRWEKAS